MLNSSLISRWLAAGLVAALAGLSVPAQASSAFDSVLASPQRSAENRARDVYRHPAETLEFFGIKPNMTVVEISPGGGWYTEILAPWLRDNGKLYAAHYAADAGEYYRKSLTAFKDKLAADPAVYDRVVLSTFTPPNALEIAPPGSADAVVTFRNVHNHMKKEGGEEVMMRSAFAALKPGGVFGVVDHRATPGTSREQMYQSGYIAEELVIKAAQAAGFILEARSEINANPRDNHQHPKGVWTLPPSLALGDEDRATYVAIGESDRMTLRFRKPAQ